MRSREEILQRINQGVKAASVRVSQKNAELIKEGLIDPIKIKKNTFQSASFPEVAQQLLNPTPVQYQETANPVVADESLGAQYTDIVPMVGAGLGRFTSLVGTGMAALNEAGSYALNAVSGKPYSVDEALQNFADKTKLLGGPGRQLSKASQEEYSKETKQALAELGAIGNNHNLTETQGAAETAKWATRNPGTVAVLLGENLIGSGLGTSAVGTVLPKAMGLGARVSVGTGIQEAAGYLDERANETGTITKDNVKMATAVGIVNGTLEKYLGGTGKNFDMESNLLGLNNISREALKDLPMAMGREARTEAGQEWVSNAAGNIEDGEEINKGAGSASTLGAILGAGTTAVYATPHLAMEASKVTGQGTAASKNLATKTYDTVKKRYQNATDPYNYDVHSDPVGENYQPVRAFNESMGTIINATTAEEADLAAKQGQEVIVKATKHLNDLRDTYKAATTDEEKAAAKSAVEDFVKNHYNPLQQARQAMEGTGQAKTTNANAVKATGNDYVAQKLDQYVQANANTQTAPNVAAVSIKPTSGTNTTATSTTSNTGSGGLVRDMIIGGKSEISSSFGKRNAPTAGASTDHNGADIKATLNTPIKAPMGGVIVGVNTHKTGGKQLMLRLDNGYTLGFAHLNEQNFKPGDKVNAGDVIALSGNTGKSTGPHIHFTVRDPQGNRVDPTNFSLDGNTAQASAPTHQANNTDIKSATVKQLPNGKWVSDNPILDRFIAIESAGIANAGNGQHQGLFQLSAALRAKYGITNPHDPQQNLMGAKRYIEENSAGLKAAGIPIDTTSLYLAHQQGMGGMSAIYKAAQAGQDIPYRPELRSKGGDIRYNMDNNGGKGKSPKEFMEYWANRIESDYAKINKANGTQGISLDAVTEQASPVAEDTGVSALEKARNALAQAISQRKSIAEIQELQKQVEELKAQAVAKGETVQPSEEQKAQSKSVVVEAAQQVRANTLDASHIDQLEHSGVLTEEDANELRRMLDIKRVISSQRTPEQVDDAVYKGSKGATTAESDIGLNEYQTVLDDAIEKNDTATLDNYLGKLDNFAQNQTSKAAALEEAIAMNPSNAKPLYIAPDENNNWKVYEGRTSRNKSDPTYQAGAYQVWTVGNKVVETNNRIIQNATDVASLHDAYQSIVSNRQANGLLDNLSPKTTSSRLPKSKFANQTTSTVAPVTAPKGTTPTGNTSTISTPTTATKTFNNTDGNVRTVSYNEAGSVKGALAEDEVWVGHDFTKNSGGKTQLNFETDGKYKRGLSGFTYNNTDLEGNPDSRSLAMEMFGEHGMFGNPYRTNAKGKFAAKNHQEALNKYVNLVKDLTTSSHGSRLQFLESLEQLRGKKLVTDADSKQEAKFLDHILNAPEAQPLWDAMKDSNNTMKVTDRQAKVDALQEWVASVEAEYSAPNDKGKVEITGFKQSDTTKAQFKEQRKAERSKKDTAKTAQATPPSTTEATTPTKDDDVTPENQTVIDKAPEAAKAELTKLAKAGHTISESKLTFVADSGEIKDSEGYTLTRKKAFSKTTGELKTDKIEAQLPIAKNDLGIKNLVVVQNMKSGKFIGLSAQMEDGTTDALDDLLLGNEEKSLSDLSITLSKELGVPVGFNISEDAKKTPKSEVTPATPPKQETPVTATVSPPSSIQAKGKVKSKDKAPDKMLSETELKSGITLEGNETIDTLFEYLNEEMDLSKPNDLAKVMDKITLDGTVVISDDNTTEYEYLRNLILAMANYMDKPKLVINPKATKAIYNPETNTIETAISDAMFGEIAAIVLKQATLDIADDIDSYTENLANEVSVDNAEYPTVMTENDVNSIEEIKAIHTKLAKAKKALNRDLLSKNLDDLNLDSETRRAIYVLANSSLGDFLSVSLSNKKVREYLKTVTYKDKQSKSKSSLYTYISRAFREFFGFTNKEANVLDTLLSITGDIATIKLNESDFAESMDARQAVLKATEKQITQELKKPYKTRNRFVVSFTQGKDKPLASIKDLMTKIAQDPVKAAQYLLGEQLSPEQEREIKYFADFSNKFTIYLKSAYAENPQMNKDLKSYLFDPTTGNLDTNLAGALTLAVYDYIKSNGNKNKNTYDDVKKILNVDKGSNVIIPGHIYRQYAYKGNLASFVAADLGKVAVAALGINETGNAIKDSKSELEMSLGNWALHAMQIAELGSLQFMSQEQHLNNIKAVRGTEPGGLSENGSDYVFFTFKSAEAEPKSTRVEEIIKVSKNTKGIVAKLFNIESGIRYPKLIEPSKVKRKIKKSRSLVSNLQATFMEAMQREPIEVDTVTYDVMDSLLNNHNSWFKHLVGAAVTKSELDQMHINDRESAEAAAEGLEREIDNGMSFIGSLKHNKKGFQNFWDSVYTASNNRMHFNSNVFNMQTSIIQRMMASYKNFRTTINMEGVNLDNLLEHALDDKGNPTKIGFFLSAIAMNMEDFDSALAADIKDTAGTELKSYTKDKVYSKDFMPAFVKLLQTDKVQSAVSAMQKAMNKQKLSKSELKAIEDFVDTAGMKMQSVRALIELTNMVKAMENGSELSTGIGLGSDGINNGIALASIYNGVATTRTLLQTGFIPKNDRNIKTQFDTKLHKDIGDYYEAFAEVFTRNMQEVKENINSFPSVVKAIDVIEAIQPAFDIVANPKAARKLAKAIIIPFGYSAGIDRLVQVAQESFISDIQKKMAKLANDKSINNTSPDYVEFQEQLQILLDDKKFTLPEEPSALLEFWFTPKQLGALSNTYETVVEKALKNSLEEFAGVFKSSRERNITMHEATFEMFNEIRESIIANATADMANQLNITLDEMKDRGFTNKEWDTLVEPQIARITPKIINAFATTQGDIENSENIDLIEDSLSSLEVLSRGKKFVGGKVLSKVKGKNVDDLLQMQENTLPAMTRIVKKVGVFINSAQIQGTDGRISAEASAMLGGKVNLNIHDQNDGGLDNYLNMVLTQNKATFKTLATNHLQLNSLESFVETLQTATAMYSEGTISELVYRGILNKAFFGISRSINPEHTRKTKVWDIDKTEIMDLLTELVNDTEKGKIDILTNLEAVQQYAGEMGEYIVTDEDIKLVTKELDKITSRMDALVKSIEDNDLLMKELAIPATKPENAPNTVPAPKNAQPTGKVVLTGKSPYLAKDQAKSDQANKFIGYGVAGSSTNTYRLDWGKNANTGNYSNKDKVFVSINGDRKDRIRLNDGYKSQLNAAMKAGATLITDNVSDRNRAFNVGERELAQYLQENGYEDKVGNGIWTKVVIIPTEKSVVGPIENPIQWIKDTINDLHNRLDTKNANTQHQLDLMEYLITRLMEVNPNIKIEVVNEKTMAYLGKDNPDAIGAHGLFYNDTIYILDTKLSNQGNRAFSTMATITHEMVHAITENQINSNDPKFTDTINQLESLRSNLERIPTNNNAIKNALTNVSELVAYGLTHPEVRDFIATHARPTAKGLSNPTKALSWFLEQVSNLFNFVKHPNRDKWTREEVNNYRNFVRLVDRLSKPIPPSPTGGNDKSKSIPKASTVTTSHLSGLSVGNSSSTHDSHLDNIIDMIDKFVGNDANRGRSIQQSTKAKTPMSIVTRLGMSDKEASVYEATRAVLNTYIKTQGNTMGVRELQNMAREFNAGQLTKEDFVDDWATATKDERNHATALFNNILGANPSNMKSDVLIKFTALALSSEKFRQILNKPRQRISKYENEDSLFSDAMSMLENGINKMTELYIHTNNKNITGQIDRLFYNLHAIDEKAHINKETLDQKVWKGIGVIGNVVNDSTKSVLAKAINLAKGSSNERMRKFGEATNELAKNDATAVGTLILDTVSKYSKLAGKRYGEGRNLVNEIVSTTHVKRVNERIARFTTSLGQLRQQIQDNTREALLDEFTNRGKDLSRAVRDSITTVALRSDMASLLEYMSITEVMALLRSPSKREQRIKDLEQQIKAMDDGNDMVMQAKALAAYMIANKGTKHLVKSTQLIATRHGLPSQVELSQMDKATYEAVNTLTSLYATRYGYSKSGYHFDQVIAQEEDGIKAMLKAHKAMIDRSRADFLTNPYNYSKGYLPNISDPHRSLVWVEPNEVAKYLTQGWQNVTDAPLKRDALDTTFDRVLLYHPHMDYQNRVSGGLDLIDTHAKGQIIYAESQDLARVAKARAQERIVRSRTMRAEDYNPFDEDTAMIATYGADGSIQDYHYEMESFLRDDYLQRNNDPFALLSRMDAKTQFKPQIEESQRAVANALYEDYKANYAKNPELFVVLDPDSLDKKVRDDYALTPYAFKVEAHGLFGDGPIVVRASVYNTVFGYKVYSLGNIFNKEYKNMNKFEKLFYAIFSVLLGEKAKSRVIAMEDVIKMLTKQVKDFIVIRGTKVLIGNILANTMLLMLQGVNPIDIMKGYNYAWQEGQRYRRSQKVVMQLRTKMMYAKANEMPTLRRQIMAEEHSMKRSSMHDYMQQGIMSTIVEDVTVLKDQLAYKTGIEQRLDDLGDKTPAPIKTAFDWMIVNPGTPMHKFLSDATQFSDFSAKYVLAEHLRKSGMSSDDALSAAQESFINFDVPQGQGMDYMGRMGLFMFTKFFFRIQRVMSKLLWEKPAQTIAQHYISESLFNMQGVLDPLMTNNLGNPFDFGALNLLDGQDTVMTEMADLVF